MEEYQQHPVQYPAHHPAQHSEKAPSGPGTIILQWLTYAFWGWTVFATSILTIAVIGNFIHDTSSGDFSAYAVAAVLVLLPIAVVCDLFYSKKEPVQKTGAASIVMVIHAVLFALITVGAFITAVFSIVYLMTSSSEHSNAKVTLYSSLIVALLYLAVLVRTILPKRLLWMRRFYVIGMVVVLGLVAVLGIFGPAAKARTTRTDRLVEDNLYNLQYSIEDYSTQNNELPPTLNSLKLTGDTKILVSDSLVAYTPNTKKATTSGNSNVQDYGTTNKTYYFQLCVNYQKPKTGSSDYGGSSQVDKSGYASYLTVGDHGAGRVCYKLKTQGY
jgi:hypothetical protein